MRPDHEIAILTLTDLIEWIMVRDKKRLGERDVSEKLKDIDLIRDLLGEEDAG